MRAREREDGNGAWVNLFSVHALSNAWPLGTAAASEAAAWSLSQSLRAEMAGSGVKVLNVLFGPLDEASSRHLPPPKVTHDQLAKAVVEALRQGIEDLAVGPVAEDLVRRYREDPMALHREMVYGKVLLAKDTEPTGLN
jgi:short-subunit dehydrogenase